ncbi:biotin/lipoyl-containing protein, partial [Alcanivorax sp. HI0044]|uniref:biotin/lipoyl-containing protein n=2 Tax=Alcanivorax TaxID=59753 RepID=UPI000A7AD6E3
MATDIKAPQFPESVADGTVATWHKQEGEAVKRDELLVDIETDKVVLEVVAPADGVISKIMAAEGETVESQQVLGTFDEGASGSAGKSDDKPAEKASDEASAEQKNDAKSEAADDDDS